MAAVVGKALIGAVVGATMDVDFQLAGQAASQMINNYKNDRDILDLKKDCFSIDWRSIAISGAFGTVAPGLISSAKTVNNS